MSRWPPDSAARLKACALELFAERGFASVTAAEIAARAGMTERTFFRHYRAKEDVLFDDRSGVREALASAIATAPEGASARALMQAVADVLGDRFEPERSELRIYSEVVNREPALRARALLRDQDWALAIAGGFRRRGFSRARAARLAGVMGTVFRAVFDEWLTDRARTGLAKRFASALAELSSDLK